MQCLSSPTRDEIKKAHSKGVWLDIGVLSVRNLRRLSKARVTLWWLLVIKAAVAVFNDALRTVSTGIFGTLLSGRE